uniref:Alpha-actitoxin-Ms11a-1 n=1 Tax=Metridium senile TaxID=6116 RepID=AITX1_METSE|nr:RecName: Full=Alpha-actitoxin-Ms11a-1; Short=Alpha-AITX-Ms11a-1; AltName: Full=Alpha-anmTX-Ms11a-1; Flags: Precursor [Metridium senile]WCB99795.1 nAChR-binding peptide Ms11-1 [Metridium senile]
MASKIFFVLAVFLVMSAVLPESFAGCKKLNSNCSRQYRECCHGLVCRRPNYGNGRGILWRCVKAKK